MRLALPVRTEPTNGPTARTVSMEPRVTPLLRDNGKKAEGDKDVLKAIALNPKLKDPTKAVTGSDTVEAP